MFKAGEKIICIKESKFHDCEGEVGQVYTVKSHTCGNGLKLVEQKNDVGLDSRRFLPYTEELDKKFSKNSEKKKQMKKQLDELRKKLENLEKIYNEME